MMNPIPGFGSLRVQIINYSSSGYYNGLGWANMTVPSGWVMTCPGGIAYYTNQGRMLESIYPYAPPGGGQGTEVVTKDAIVRDCCAPTYAYGLLIQKQ
jgi:hypothetical protein